MKKINPLLTLILSILIISGCAKVDTVDGPSNSKTPSKVEQVEVLDYFASISKVAVYNETMDKIIILEPGLDKNGFTFVNPDDGWNFGTTDNIQFVEGPNGQEVLFIPANGGVGSGAGGVVTAGNSTLSIDFAFCFSVDDETLFGNPGGAAPVDGISGVFGFSGDLEALTEQDFSEEGDPFEFFNGWAYYWVYADDINGSYDILNWLDDAEEPVDQIQDKGFAFVYDFNEGHLYWSVDGTLSASDGAIEFDGNYWAWLNVLDVLIEGEDDLEDFSFDEVAGSGFMGCD